MQANLKLKVENETKYKMRQKNKQQTMQFKKVQGMFIFIRGQIVVLQSKNKRFFKRKKKFSQ